MWDYGTINKKTTGLPVNISLMLWLDEEDEDEKWDGTPVIMFQNDYANRLHYDSFLKMTIGEHPTVIARSEEIRISEEDIVTLSKWISRNRDILLSYWNMEISTVDAIKALFGLI